MIRVVVDMVRELYPKRRGLSAFSDVATTPDRMVAPPNIGLAIISAKRF